MVSLNHQPDAMQDMELGDGCYAVEMASCFALLKTKEVPENMLLLEVAPSVLSYCY